MITVLIRTVDEGKGRQLRCHGVVYLDYDPASMRVIARFPNPRKMTELVQEHVPLLSCVRALPRRHGLPARKIRRALDAGEHLRLETGPTVPVTGSPPEGPKLPRPPASWDGEAAMHKALQKHVLDDRAHATEEAAFNAALGEIIVAYLDSLPTKDRLEALLGLKGPEGFEEERMLHEAEEGGREGARLELVAAAKALHAEGKLRRVRRHADGRVLWRPAGPLLLEGAARGRQPRGRPGERPRPAVAPEGAHDGGPQTGGPEM